MSVILDYLIANAVRSLDRWLDAMRVDWPTTGYGGPVVHWWRHSLDYHGAGLDWRYEGIVAGYLTLHRRTGERRWRDKAVRAGQDLIDGQLPDGHFRNSRFEQNPGEGGTPHEAACDTALLRLADALRGDDPVMSRRFLDAAMRNLDSYWFGRLWHEPTRTLWDAPGVPSFVPNKAATFLEAVLLLADITGDTDLISRYGLPTGERIVEMQLRLPGDVLDGAIAQNRFAGGIVAAYFPLYIARCVPPLLKLYERTGDARFRDAGLAAARFVEGVREPDGGFPQVLYPRGRRNRRPRWIAGAGDMVRAMVDANRYGLEADCEPTIRWILRGLRRDGHIATAEGFERVVPLILRRDRALNDIGVVGWCDKAFRALAAFVDPDVIDSPGVAEPEKAGVGMSR